MRAPPSFSVAGRPVGPGHPSLIIAEIAQAHDGSLGMAHAFIDAAAGASADAIKFQTHLAHAESTPGEPFRVPFSKQDASRYDYWRRMEFSPEQWAGLAEHARERGLIFLSTPFSHEAIALLEALDLAAWKIGSGELENLPLLERAAQGGRPLLLSTGMGSWDHIDAAVAAVQAAGAPVGLFQCTTAYPTAPEQLGLNLLAELRARYQVPVGLSDHSGQIYASLGAATLGANLLEVHLTFSHQAFGPDVPASLTPAQLAQLVEGVRYLEAAQAHPVDKEAMAGELSELRTLFGRSVVAARPLSPGQALGASDLALKKPGGGLPPAALSGLIGRRLTRALAADERVEERDLD